MNRNAEKIVGMLLVVFLVLTAAFQTLIARDVINPVSAVDMREDITVYENSEYYPKQYSITLNVSDNNAKIMVNGYYTENKIGQNGDISFNIYSGDVVECDLRECEGDVEVKLVKKDSSLIIPANNFYAQSSGNILYLFKANDGR